MKFHQILFRFYESAAKKMCEECREFILPDAKILDVGCDSGIIAKTFADCFSTEVSGTDIEDNRIVPIPFKVAAEDELPFPDNSFDIILINYVLHHSQNPLKILREAKRVSRQRIIIYEDLPAGFWAKMRCWLHQTTYNIFFKGERKKFSFKTEKEWIKLFDELELTVLKSSRASVRFDLFDPVKRNLFVLEK
ncbi:MAG: class I SAM-dependent methyltransferase [bacterium]